MTTEKNSRARDRAAQLFAEAEFEADVMHEVVRTVSSETTGSPSLSSLLNRAGGSADRSANTVAPSDAGYHNLRASLPNFVNAGASSLLQRAADQWQKTNALAATRLETHYRQQLETKLAEANATMHATDLGEITSARPPSWVRPGTILDEKGNPIANTPDA